MKVSRELKKLFLTSDQQNTYKVRGHTPHLSCNLLYIEVHLLLREYLH